jgi:PiT family inorganic phosphate transporter
MNTTSFALLLAAWVFALINGVNDGGSLLAAGLTLRGVPPVAGAAMLGAAVFVLPMAGVTAVARTLSDGLARGSQQASATIFLIAVTTAIVVTAALSSRGLPTSLTLALIGAVSGAAGGEGEPVASGRVVTVLLIAAAAPAVGGLAGHTLSRLARRVPVPEGVPTRLRWMHLACFTAMSVAYGANDGQKVSAVIIVALAVSRTESLPALPIAVAAALFAFGALLGIRRMARTVGRGILPVRPPDAVTTELASAGVVLATAALGTPVSMTQAMSGALVGVGLTYGGRRVRWRTASRVAGAWVATLPCAFIIAAGGGLVLRLGQAR